jgi:HEAT repeat protein
VQRLTDAALGRIERRWPTLARLLGRTPHVEVTRSPERTAVPAPPDVAAPPADARTTQALIGSLRDTSAEVAVDAAETLGARPGEETIAALREVLANREGYFSGVTRAAAARSLGAILPPGGLSPLYTAVTDVDAEVSLAAIAALVERAEDGCADALLTLLEDANGFYLPPTRRAAARGLDRIRGADPARVKTLVEREADSVVREALSPIALPS